jgi:hypothetical protein
MSEKKAARDRPALSRRDFIKSTTAAGLGAAVAGRGRPQKDYLGTRTESRDSEHVPGAAALQEDELRVALIGCGEQGRVLLESCLRISGIRIVAVCDIWEYSRQYASGYLGKYDQPATVYEDYRELLTKEKGLDAAIMFTARRRCRTPWRRPGAWCRRRGGPGSSSRSVISAAATRATFTPSTA